MKRYLKLGDVRIPIIVSKSVRPDEVLLAGPPVLEERDGRTFTTVNLKACVKLVNVGIEPWPS